MNRNSAKQMAFGGVMAALAVVLMWLGSVLYIATFVSPLLCCMMLRLVLMFCGSRVSWAWYGAVSVLCLLLVPDKESAAVFAFLGYYPIVKPWFDRRKLRVVWKALYFNGSVFVMYALLIYVMGMEQLLEEFSGMGSILLVVTLAMCNLVFWMLDRILERKRIRRR